MCVRSTSPCCASYAISSRRFRVSQSGSTRFISLAHTTRAWLHFSRISQDSRPTQFIPNMSKLLNLAGRSVNMLLPLISSNNVEFQVEQSTYPQNSLIVHCETQR